METISWNAMGEGAYERIDYITINGYALNLDLLKGVSFSHTRIDITVQVKHGFTTFTELLNKTCTGEVTLTARCSNYHGGYLLVSGIIAYGQDTVFCVPDSATITFAAKDIRLKTHSEFEESIYLTEVQKKD